MPSTKLETPVTTAPEEYEDQRVDGIYPESVAPPAVNLWDPLIDKTPEEITNDDDLFARHLMSLTPRLHEALDGFMLDPQLIPDVIQETLFRAVEKGNRAAIMRDPVTWLRTTAYRITVSEYRRQQVRPQEFLYAEPYLFEVESGGLSVEDQVIARDGAAHILNILAEHDAKSTDAQSSNNELVELFSKLFLEDMSRADYARLKGVPARTIGSRQTGGRKLVRRSTKR